MPSTAGDRGNPVIVTHRCWVGEVDPERRLDRVEPGGRALHADVVRRHSLNALDGELGRGSVVPVEVLRQDEQSFVTGLAPLGIDAERIVGEAGIRDSTDDDDAVMSEPGPADVELGDDPDSTPGAEALLVVDVVEALALAVVGAELEGHQPDVVELVLVTQAGAHVVGEKAGRHEQVIGRPGEQTLAAAALDRWQVGGRSQLVSAVGPLFLARRADRAPPLLPSGLKRTSM